MQTLLLVTAGGAAGTAARYGVARLLTTATPAFPWATLTVNVLGALAVGFAARYFVGVDGAMSELRTTLTMGFCGGFTTMSAFSLETVMLYTAGYPGRAGIYAATTLIASLVAVVVGFDVAGRFG